MNSRRWLAVALIAVLVVLSWRSLNSISADAPLDDSGVFSSVATHLLAGKALYREAWDHKPPVVHLLNALALRFGGQMDSIRTLEALFAVAGCLAMFALVARLLGSLWLGFVGGAFLLILLYHPKIFHDGNWTTEYGAVFVLAAAAAAIESRRARPGLQPLLAALGAALLSLAVLTKETFLLSGAPWAVYLLWPPDGRGPAWRRRWAAVVIGGAIPLAAIVAYLAGQHALTAWLEVIDFNFANVGQAHSSRLGRLMATVVHAHRGVSSTLVLAAVGAGAAVAALTRPAFVGRLGGVPVVVAVELAGGIVATGLTGRNYPHYYLQIVPPFVLLAVIGLAFLLGELGRAPGGRVLGPLLACAVLLVGDASQVVQFLRRAAEPAVAWQPGAAARYVIAHTTPADPIWAPAGRVTHMYMATDRLSPTKWVYAWSGLFIDTRSSTAAEKRAQLLEDLERTPPRLIVLDPDRLAQLEKVGVADWVARRYQEVFLGDDGLLVLARRP